MKTYLGFMLVAALALTACGGHEDAKPAEASHANTATATASSANLATASASQMASASGECAITINSDDAMKYDNKEINVKSSCKEFTITLNHTGQMPKAGMGHNLVIAKEADKNNIISDGAASGADKDYLKPEDTRVIAATKLIGGGESDTITFPVNKLMKGESYVFFCTFPGHVATMNGKVNLLN